MASQRVGVETRTLHLTNAWHASSGGVRTLYRALLDAANRAGRRMAVVVPGEALHVTRVGGCGRIYSIPAPASPILDRRYRTIMPRQFLGRSTAIQAILAHEQPDVVEVSDKYTLFHVAGLIKRRAGRRPTVVGLSHERFEDTLQTFVTASGMARALARTYLAAVYLRQFDAHLANSRYTADELSNAIEWWGPGWPALWRQRDRIHVLPLGVDPMTFTPDQRSAQMRADLLHRAGGNATSSLVLFAGRLSREKQVDWLVPAVAQAVRAGHDARLVVAGDGPARGAIERAAAAQLPARLVMLGHVDRDYARLLASADVFLHPNPREPFGLAPLEAMASGVPLVVPASGGVLSYVSEANAWLAQPDSIGLGRALAEALSHPERGRAKAQAARARAEQLSWAHIASTFFRTYDAIHARRIASAVAAEPTGSQADPVARG